MLTDKLLELPALVLDLAEAQRRTEQRVDTLAATLQELKTTVNHLQQTFGATLEEEAASVLEAVMREKGFRALAPETTLAVDGEIDVLMPFADPAGRRIWALVETEARLNQRDVRAWIQQARDAAWQQRLAERGVSGVCYLYFYAIRVDKGALELISAEGVGLLKSEGEVIAPQGWIEL
ncbi:MAG: hypothetical protein RMJ86_01405 [Anaerolineae bacterium]|nr:hypothetical protein [Anaerolineae bacterium]